MSDSEGRFHSGKDAHIEACVSGDVEAPVTTGFEDVVLAPGFPTFSISDIALATDFLGKPISLPLLISPITGGGQRSLAVNRNLATAAEQLRIPMAVGSQRPMLEGKTSAESYLVRKYAPTIPLLANLGLVHVKRGRDYLLRAVESIEADGVILYVNPLHEILQVDGELDFRDVLERLAAVLADFPYPLFLKEVGFGFPDDLIAWSASRNVAGIDVAGLGGTNWALIEGWVQGRNYGAYAGLGKRTRDAVIAAARNLRPEQIIIASGGIRTGVEMAKAFGLGAHMAAMALPFLRWALVSHEEVVKGVEELKRDLTIAMWYAGARTAGELKGKAHQEGKSS